MNKIDSAGEWFPLVNEDGKEVGKAPRSICHDGKSKLLHPVVHLHVMNPAGEFFLQKRALTKDIEPGKWDTSVGGHAAIGETPETALKRETEEELGLTGINPVFITRYIWESKRERELVYSHFVITDCLPEINRDEIDDGKFWDMKEIKDNMGKGIFTPNFEYEFAMVSGILESFSTKKRE